MESLLQLINTKSQAINKLQNELKTNLTLEEKNNLLFQLNELIDEKLKLLEIKDKLHINKNIQKDDNKEDIQLIEEKNIIPKKRKNDIYEDSNESKIYIAKSINHKHKKKGWLSNVQSTNITKHNDNSSSNENFNFFEESQEIENYEESEEIAGSKIKYISKKNKEKKIQQLIYLSLSIKIILLMNFI